MAREDNFHVYILMFWAGIGSGQRNIVLVARSTGPWTPFGKGDKNLGDFHHWLPSNSMLTLSFRKEKNHIDWAT